MRGMAREYAAGNSLGPGWRESAGIFVVRWVGRRRCRQADGMARSRAKARLNFRPRPAIRKMQGQPACRAGEPSGQGEERRRRVLVVAIRSPRP